MVIGGPDIDGENRFHRILGEALTSWQLVESSAYHLFVAIMGKTDQKLVSVIFHHTKSFDSRVGLIDRCADFAISADELTDRWKALRKRLDKSTTIRNRLVHFSAGYTHSQEFKGYTLGPSHFDATYVKNDRWKNPDFKIDQARLEEIGYEFGELAADISVFIVDLESIAKQTRTKRSSRSAPAKSVKRSK